MATTKLTANETFDVWFDQDGMYCIHGIFIAPHHFLSKECTPMDRYPHLEGISFKECIRITCKAFIGLDSNDSVDAVVFLWEDGESELDIIALGVMVCPDVFL